MRFRVLSSFDLSHPPVPHRVCLHHFLQSDLEIDTIETEELPRTDMGNATELKLLQDNKMDADVVECDEV